MKTKILPAFAGMLLFFIACQSGKKPSGVAEKFLHAVNEKDFIAAREYATAETGKLIDLMEQLQKMSESTDSIAPIDFEIVDEKIDGNEAVVTFREKGSTETDELRLQKVGDQWKVNVTKQDLAAKDNEDAEEGAGGIFGDSGDTIPHPDSLEAAQPF